MFHFNLALKPTDLEAETHEPDQVYDDELDNVTSVLADICDRLEDLKVCEFSVGGFGQIIWRVDVRYDLLAFLEQIIGVLEGLNTNKMVDLSFPEQGMQRIIHITPLNGCCRLSCTSFGNWIPSTEIIEIDRLQLKRWFVSATEAFISASETYCPHLSRNRWFVDWKNQLSFVTAQ